MTCQRYWGIREGGETQNLGCMIKSHRTPWDFPASHCNEEKTEWVTESWSGIQIETFWEQHSAGRFVFGDISYLLYNHIPKLAEIQVLFYTHTYSIQIWEAKREGKKKNLISRRKSSTERWDTSYPDFKTPNWGLDR